MKRIVEDHLGQVGDHVHHSASSAQMSQHTAQLLVVDDQKNMRATTAMILRSAGYQVEEAATGNEALDLLGSRSFDVLLTDLRMEPMDGLTLLKRTLSSAGGTQVIVMTAFGTVESAVQALQLGACDYLCKPFKEDELLIRVQRALEKRRLLTEVALLGEDFKARWGLVGIVGRSAPMRELASRISRVAPTEATVLIEGESGTGKELVARAVHALSRRSSRPFVPVNCAAVSETLLESELFGHARGSFTGAVKARRGLFEEADGGTFFIDEVGETGPAFQAKLLRVLQEGEIRRVGESLPVKVDVRVIAATNQDLRRAVAEKRFREDLFYRLNVVPFHLPPLRERKEDIEELATHFLQRVNGRDLTRKRLTPGSLEALRQHDFPGNVRELENAVEKAAALAEHDELTAEDFVFTPQLREPRLGAGGGGTLEEVVARAEREAIEAVLQRHAGNLALAAQSLGVSTTTLWRKMKRLEIKSPTPPAIPKVLQN